MKKVICFPFLAAVLLVLQGCEYNPEVNDENCTDAKALEIRKKLNNSEKWQIFIQECEIMRFAKLEEERKKNPPKPPKQWLPSGEVK